MIFISVQNQNKSKRIIVYVLVLVFRTYLVDVAILVECIHSSGRLVVPVFKSRINTSFGIWILSLLIVYTHKEKPAILIMICLLTCSVMLVSSYLHFVTVLELYSSLPFRHMCGPSLSTRLNSTLMCRFFFQLGKK